MSTVPTLIAERDEDLLRIKTGSVPAPWCKSLQRISFCRNGGRNCRNMKRIRAIKLVAAPRYHMSLGSLAKRRDEGSSGPSTHHRAAEPA